MNWKYEKAFERIFSYKEIATSNEITMFIREMYPKCGKDNARNVIRTAVKNNTIESIPGITLGHNSKLYCRKGMKYTKQQVNEILMNHDNKLSNVVDYMIRHNGIIPYLNIFKLTGCLVGKSNAHTPSIHDIVHKINGLFDCKTVTIEGNNFLVQKNMFYEEGDWVAACYNQIKMRKHECVLLRLILYWLKKQNMINSIIPLYRNELTPLKGVTYNNMIFDIVAYSSVSAFQSDDNLENAIVVIDSEFENIYTKSNFNGFYSRIQVLRNGVKAKKRRVIPIIVASEFSDEVRAECRNMNILIYSLNNIYGSRFNEIITSMNNLEMLTSFEDSFDVTKEVQSTLQVIKESGQTDNLENLHGILFEYLMHSIIYKWLKGNLAGDLITGKKIVYDEKNDYKFEFDIIAPLDEEYLVIELKGYANSKYIKWSGKDKNGKIEKETIGWFFRNTFPVAQKFYKNNPEDKKVTACFITTAHFDLDAKDKLADLNKGKIKSQYLDVTYDGNQLIDKLKELQLSREVDVLRQFYFNR